MIKSHIARLIMSALVVIGGVYLIGPYITMFSFIDYIEYWSSARLATLDSNPYDNQEMLQLQQSIGWPDGKGDIENPSDAPLMMWNPP